MKLLLFLCLILATTSLIHSICYKTHSKKQKRVPRPLNSLIGSNSGTSKSLNAFEVCLCGAFATIIGDFVMHPVDTVKITQQAAATTITALEAIKQIIARGGPLAFYQGVVPYLVADGLSGAVKFATFEASKKFLEARVPEKYHSITNFVCAAGAMIACSFILVPGEVLKTRLQAGAALSLGGTIAQILKSEGIRGLYAGYYATLVRDVPYTMLELGVYENVKNFIKTLKEGSSSGLTQKDELLAAAFTGGVAAFLTTPLDVIKTKLMMQAGTGGQYKGVLDAFSSIYQADGLGPLFAGASARVTWLIPFTTIYLGIYELTKRGMLSAKNKLED